MLSSLSGIDLDARTTARHLSRAGGQDGAARAAALAFRVTQPELTTSEARALGATRSSASATTTWALVGQPRLQRRAAREAARRRDRQAGRDVLVQRTVGKRTAERGFKEGQAIENGVLVPSIGGGVCQAATTVFDAAFAGGYEVAHRINHSFYISHYPLGLDATVADAGPDFTFVNDTPNALVIKATATPVTMTVSFLSRPLNRHVEYERRRRPSS